MTATQKQPENERRQLYRVERVARDVVTGGQRQDSLEDQLRDVARLADAAGCYDAADFIRRTNAS